MKASKLGRWPGYAAAVWALIFALFHVLWAAGWYIGLEYEPAQHAFGKEWFLVYDIVVATMLVFAVFVALSLVGAWGKRVPRRLVRFLAWSGTVLLLVRGGGGALQDLYLVAVGRMVWKPMLVWEVWFCVGAGLFLLTSWRFGRGQET